MIVDNAFNRKIIAEYLDTLSEDSFIDEVIISLFSKNGYLLYRKNIHGPGEHGKDLVFYRHVPLFYDNEYIVVQAKSEKVNVSNISKFANQLVRALKVPFPGKSKGQIHPNYVIFINSQPHTNDANFEFHYLSDMKDNIKILSQENIIELMLKFDLFPESLKGKIEVYENDSRSISPISAYDESIRQIILGHDNLAINKLLDHDLVIDPRPLSSEIKELIINYIFQKWDQDSSWEGTVKPMKWLRYYFDYIQPSQSHKLAKVFEEYVSSAHSFKAFYDTESVVSKITPSQILPFEKTFIDIVVRNIRDSHGTKHPLLFVKFDEFAKSGLMSKSYILLTDQIQQYRATKEILLKTTNEDEKESLRNILRHLNDDFYYFLYPDERE